MNFTDFGMDTASLAGSLEAKLAAVRQAGFAQVMVSATDVVAHPGGVSAAARAIRDSGLRVTGYEALRDFEGLTGHLHAYKIDVAKGMLAVCGEIGARVLVVEASTSTHADPDPDVMAQDLRKLAVLAIPLGIRIAFKGTPPSRTVRDWIAAWDVVNRANCPNLGLAVDSFDTLSVHTSVDGSTKWARTRSASCSFRITCGPRSGRRRSRPPPRSISACFRARACTAIRWPTW